VRVEKPSAKLVYKYYEGRIEEMKIFRRNLLLASSALALVMLFGCSSTEESSGSSSDTSGETGQEVDCSTYPTDHQQAECEAGKEIID
jgi:hypothetical protein